ncbi:T9SS C-terminal target domain-containing protein [Aquimarina sp. BL5]|uniref:T9SS type A sorting domain-containing protein n=1 Tax=Aquimarina sp. BL5 TaxID=1714860 RepID=UPI000E535D76|nr:T9SS type A sorting domain-containing protein [Aquimarina sp. BL5]AXT50473.1 T9SS C-terminal target domain-containing protein [Aquimarina sp. BL5]RKN03051.1 T9SS C-terminal target domain-containing protein [Aquimarina sp. BL5]
MKNLLLLLTTLGSFSFISAQTYDNSTYFINEIIPSPPNSSSTLVNHTDNTSVADHKFDADDTFEYFEFRGTPNATIDDGVYFIVVDGDGDDSDVGSNIGKVRDAIDLSGLTFGSNGILSIVANMTFEAGSVDQSGANIEGTKMTNPYAAALAASGANVITVELEGTPVWTDELDPEDGSLDTLNNFTSVSAVTNSIGYDGSINDQSSTYMLIKSTTGSPKDLIIDTDENGIIDDATAAPGADHLSWTIYDSVSILDDDDISSPEVGEFAYGQIIFVEILTDSDPFLNYDNTLSTVVTLQQYPMYIARFDGTTGYVGGTDWMAGRLNSNSFPEWQISTNEARNIPVSLTGTTVPLDTYGEPNITTNVLSITEQELTEDFSFFPNPTTNVINISSKNDIISSIEVVNITGQILIQKDSNLDVIDLTDFSTGLYYMNIYGDGAKITKAIVKN